MTDLLRFRVRETAQGDYEVIKISDGRRVGLSASIVKARTIARRCNGEGGS